MFETLKTHVYTRMTIQTKEHWPWWGWNSWNFTRL